MCNNHRKGTVQQDSTRGKKLTSKCLLILDSKQKWLSQLWFCICLWLDFQRKKVRSASFLIMNLGKQEVKTVSGRWKHNGRREPWSRGHWPMGSLEMKPALQIPYFLRKVQPREQKAWNQESLPMGLGGEVGRYQELVSLSSDHQIHKADLG